MRASVGEYLDEHDSIEDNNDVEDSADIEVAFSSDSTAHLSTRAWQGSSLYVDIEPRDDFADEDLAEDNSECESVESGLIQTQFFGR